MSVVGLATTAVERETGVRKHKKALTPPPEDAAKDPEKISQSNIDLLAQFVPTEILTGYVTIVAAIIATVTEGEKKLPLRWTMFWVFLGITPIFLFAVYLAKGGQSGKRKAPWIEMVAATIAFAALAIALPDSPVSSLSWYEAFVPVMAVVAAIILLAPLAPLVQKKVT